MHDRTKIAMLHMLLSLIAKVKVPEKYINDFVNFAEDVYHMGRNDGISEMRESGNWISRKDFGYIQEELQAVKSDLNHYSERCTKFSKEVDDLKRQLLVFKIDDSHLQILRDKYNELRAQRENPKIEFIKFLRNYYAIGLKLAKDLAEDLLRNADWDQDKQFVNYFVSLTNPLPR